MDKEYICTILEQILVSVKMNKLNNEQLDTISKFIMYYKFKDESEFSNSDLIKYLSLGFYIYSMKELE